MDTRSRPRHSRAFVRLILLVLLAIIPGYRLAVRFVAGPPADGPRSAAFLNRVAANINPLFPRQVDSETEITRVSALEGVFIYHYRFINVMVAEVPRAVVARLRPTVMKASCANEATLNNFIRKDIVLRYYYSDKSGRALASFDITRADCGV
jgi:hypothetical protein